MKKLLIFALSLDFNLHDTSEEGTVWLLRNYEAYFDEVHYVLLCGKPSPPITRGNTTLISLATGNMKLDVILAPLRLLKIARRVRPTAYQTVEIVLAWWAGSLARVFAPAKIYLFPLVLPEVIYQVNGRSLTTFMPIWLERLV